METKTSIEIRTDYISKDGYVSAKNTTTEDPIIDEIMFIFEATLHNLGFPEKSIEEAYEKRLDVMQNSPF